MKQSVQTYFGNSDSSYGGEKLAISLKTPLQEIGKVNGVSPEIWPIVKIPLLNSLRDAVHEADFKYCLSGDTIRLVGY